MIIVRMNAYHSGVSAMVLQNGERYFRPARVLTALGGLVHSDQDQQAHMI